MLETSVMCVFFCAFVCHSIQLEIVRKSKKWKQTHIDEWYVQIMEGREMERERETEIEYELITVESGGLQSGSCTCSKFISLLCTMYIVCAFLLNLFAFSFILFDLADEYCLEESQQRRQ